MFGETCPRATDPDIPPIRCLLHGLTIDSDLPLPGAPTIPATGGVADIRVFWPAAGFDGRADATYLHRSATPSRPDILCTADGAHILDWAGAVRIRIDPLDSMIAISAAPDLRSSLPFVVSGWAIGYLMALRGAACLHGSAISFEGRVVAMLGESGAGKSTLAAAAVQAGARLHCDDVVVVPNPLTGRCVAPGAAALRLTDGTIQALEIPETELTRLPDLDKPLWTPNAASSDPDIGRSGELAAIYLLERGRAPEATTAIEVGPRLDAAASLLGLIRAWYPPGSQHLLDRSRIGGLAAIARDVPVRRIRHAGLWGDLPRLAAAILE